MPGTPGPVADERDNLLAYITHQVSLFGYAVHGLTDAQARSAPTVSTLSLGGLARHLGLTVRGWTASLRQTRFDGPDYAAGFEMGQQESLAGLLAELDEAVADLRTVAEAMAMGDEVPATHEPWMPPMATWSVRWVLAHLIDELARHLGHVDIIREALDGAAAASLMAAVEHWPANPWVTPWTPPRDATTP